MRFIAGQYRISDRSWFQQDHPSPYNNYLINIIESRWNRRTNALENGFGRQLEAVIKRYGDRPGMKSRIDRLATRHDRRVDSMQKRWDRLSDYIDRQRRRNNDRYHHRQNEKQWRNQFNPTEDNAEGGGSLWERKDPVQYNVQSWNDYNFNRKSFDSWDF